MQARNALLYLVVAAMWIQAFILATQMQRASEQIMPIYFAASIMIAIAGSVILQLTRPKQRLQVAT